LPGALRNAEWPYLLTGCKFKELLPFRCGIIISKTGIINIYLFTGRQVDLLSCRENDG
jgi:hypothetical protein